MSISRVRRLYPLHEETLPLTKRALVIGGGIAGIQAALDLADSSYDVVLVEKRPSIGGTMAQLDKTFPTMDCSI
jgi:heterodisulfide reductase subunit A